MYNHNYKRMKSLRNSVQLIGRLGQDPEVRETQAGKKLATFSLATSDKYTRPDGEKREDTQWHQIVVWGKLADIVSNYLKKGQEVALEGKLIHRSYEVEGERRYITEVNVNEMLMLGSKKEK